jgi:hypothetical protein
MQLTSHSDTVGPHPKVTAQRCCHVTGYAPSHLWHDRVVYDERLAERLSKRRQTSLREASARHCTWSVTTCKTTWPGFRHSGEHDPADDAGGWKRGPDWGTNRWEYARPSQAFCHPCSISRAHSQV